MEIEKMDQCDLIGNIVEFHENRPKFMLWLGAGASITSGVKSAYGMVTEMLRVLYKNCPQISDKATREMSGEELLHWAKTQPWFDKDSQAPSEYAQVIERLCRTVGSEEAFLNKMCESAVPSMGYQCLARLLQEKVFDTILTTNFDHLVRQATGNKGLIPPLREINSVEQFEHLKPYPKDARLLRLHGDFWHCNMANVAADLHEVPQARFDAVKKMMHSYGLIVIGYSGQDLNVHRDLLAKLWNDPVVLQEGLFWCEMKGQPLPYMVRSLLSRSTKGRRAYHVEIDNFDKFMEDLWKKYYARLIEAREKSEILIQERLLKEFIEQTELQALLVEVSEAVNSGLTSKEASERQQKLMKNLHLRLDAKRVVLLSKHNSAAKWRLLTSPHDEALTQATPATVESLQQLLGTYNKEYATFENARLPESNPWSQWLKAGKIIECFPVWRGDKFVGCAVFSADKSLAQVHTKKLLQAAVRLLVSLPRVA